MTTTLEAVYENGVLRPLRPVDLVEGAKVQITIRETPPPKQRQSIVEAMERIAELPLESPRDGFSGRDHDKVLYADRRK